MRFKYIWYGLIALLFLFGFFGIWTVPKDMGAWMKALVPILIPIETWLNAYAANPILVAFAAGLFLSTVFLPEAWRTFKPQFFPPSKIRHDTDGAVLFNEILAESKRAKELIKKKLLTVPVMYEQRFTDLEITEKRLLSRIADEFHDRLRDGDITAWGTPDNKKPHQKIEPHEWSEIELTACVQDLSTLPPQLHAVYRKATGDKVFAYLWIKLNRKQTLKEFPLSRFPRKIGAEIHERRHQTAI